MIIRFIMLVFFLQLPLVHAQSGSGCESQSAENLDSCLLNKQWTQEYNKNGITVYMRHQVKTDIYELFLKSRVNASAEKVYKTLADFDHYTDFMPATLSCSQFVFKDQNHLFAWQRINFNWFLNFIIDDQFYLLDVDLDDSRAHDGFYRIDWKLASDEQHQHYPASGRNCTAGRQVKSNTGYWEINERSDGQSDVAYYLRTSPSGWLVEKLGRVVAWITRTEAPNTLIRLKRHVE